jgi:protein-tyrosine phosphatase
MTRSVLFICTGNIARSPMARALMQRSLDQAGVAASVESSGTMEWQRPAEPEAIEAMASMGLDISAHISRPLAAEQIARVDIVIGLAREHVRDAALLCPECIPRMFTLKEIVRRSGEVGGPGRGESLESWLGRLTADRTLDSLLGDSTVDDIVDPIGRPVSEYRTTAAEISGLVGPLAATIALLDQAVDRSND